MEMRKHVFATNFYKLYIRKY